MPFDPSWTFSTASLGVLVMPVVHQTRATLSVVGRDLEPAEITRALGCEPTKSNRRGERVTANSGPRSKGAWSLKVLDRQPGDLDAQIVEILGKINGDPEVWQHLREKYEVYLFCGLFMRDPNEMLSIDPEQLQALAVRGIKLVLDIYDGS
jgi:hypothetical protein